MVWDAESCTCPIDALAGSCACVMYSAVDPWFAQAQPWKYRSIASGWVERPARRASTSMTPPVADFTPERRRASERIAFRSHDADLAVGNLDPLGQVAPWTKLRRSHVPFSELESSRRARSSADFITTSGCRGFRYTQGFPSLPPAPAFGADHLGGVKLASIAAPAVDRYSHPRSPNASSSTPGGAYHPPER